MQGRPSLFKMTYKSHIKRRPNLNVTGKPFTSKAFRGVTTPSYGWIEHGGGGGVLKRD